MHGKQEPFSGGSGALLDRAFDRTRVGKRDRYITNVVHCHPPRNRKSLNSPNGYRTEVDFATQMSYSGIYMHAAP